MSRSQRHKRAVTGYDSRGMNDAALGITRIPMKLLVQNLAGQTVNFATYFPTGTNFVLGSTPTGMSLNAGTGLLNGTPTTIEEAETTLTVTYTTPVGARTVVVNWKWEVGEDTIAAGAFTQNVAATPVDFGALYPGAVGFALDLIPSAMSLNATTGVLSGTPDTIESEGTVVLTRTYRYGEEVRTATKSWSWAVTA